MPGYSKPNPSSSSPTPPASIATPPPPIDLDDISEATRRALYDATVAIHFQVPPGTENHMPFYNADQARLVVIYLAGRWFASWLSLEEVKNLKLRPDAKRPLLAIYADKDEPYGITYYEV